MTGFAILTHFDLMDFLATAVESHEAMLEAAEARDIKTLMTHFDAARTAVRRAARAAVDLEEPSVPTPANQTAEQIEPLQRVQFVGGGHDGWSTYLKQSVRRMWFGHQQTSPFAYLFLEGDTEDLPAIPPGASVHGFYQINDGVARWHAVVPQFPSAVTT